MITINGVTYRNLEEQVRFNQQNINTSATAIAAETERAKAAEAANATAISNETTARANADTVTILEEISRAKAAEELNATNISTNKANITANTTDIATNAKNIADEIFRAEAAESANATAYPMKQQQEPMPTPPSIISLVRKFQELKRLMMPIAKLLQMKPPVQQELNLILELMWMLILLQY
jgi:hypothetical protein